MSEETIPQMRETIERLSKDKAGLEGSVKDLTGQLRVRDARDAFRTEGFNPKHGDLYAAVNPEGEITAEAVNTFAEDQGLPVLDGNQSGSDDGGESTSGAKDGTENLADMSGSGSGAGEGGAGGAVPETLSRQEWQALYASDPASAKAAVASGRVEISKDNVMLKPSASPGANPYAAFTQDKT